MQILPPHSAKSGFVADKGQDEVSYQDPFITFTVTSNNLKYIISNHI